MSIDQRYKDIMNFARESGIKDDEIELSVKFIVKKVNTKKCPCLFEDVRDYIKLLENKALKNEV